MSPIIGVLFHWTGGFAAGSFYAPYRRVVNWSWEVYWLVRAAVAGACISWPKLPIHDRSWFLLESPCSSSPANKCSHICPDRMIRFHE